MSARSSTSSGASHYAHRPIGELSGGEQQRLLIAQALAARPRLLLLDEPLESLDLPNQASIAALVGKVCRAEDVAVVMVAHDINPILGYVDEVIYLAGGHAAAGPPRDVITDRTLTQLYGTPVEVLTTSAGRLVVSAPPRKAPPPTTGTTREPAGRRRPRPAAARSELGRRGRRPRALPLRAS